jgi:hypothetical protein
VVRNHVIRTKDENRASELREGKRKPSYTSYGQSGLAVRNKKGVIYRQGRSMS